MSTCLASDVKNLSYHFFFVGPDAMFVSSSGIFGTCTCSDFCWNLFGGLDRLVAGCVLQYVV
ncbi:hypothetical protein TSUD_315940 [Trifolium subterraneum]|uniref:Uncharacterized protein n=1 Tax=Trifolium subterraneum TaxID=3900 RepID=A0A2Z6NHJ9_TRISU|nr:hypothetical protein TSUD_315940 [Trifolium subterraneum]